MTAWATRLHSVNSRALLLAGAVLWPTTGHATGTIAGTTISNQASATYTDGNGNTVTVPSNTVDLRVDEILNVVVASADSGDVVVTPGATERVLKYTVTNAGNGPEKFALSSLNAIGGDAFDPTTTKIVIDSNGNGSYDAGTDVEYGAGQEPLLAPDASVQVLLLSTIPGSATDTQRGATDLRAAALTGTGAAGTVFAGQGNGGGDAIVGMSTAAATARGYYAVSATGVTFAKAASVVDPFGGSRTMPGSIVTYTLTANVTGSGTLGNLAVSDPVPANTAYQAGTLTLQGSPLTDATGDDAGEVAVVAGVNQVAVRLGNVPGGATRTVSFKVKVN